MDLSSFLIRIIFLVLPGIVGARLYRILQGPSKGKDWESFLEIALFSLFSYALYGLGARILGRSFVSLNALLDENISLAFSEIIVASLISIPLAFFASFLQHRKLINEVGRRVGASEKFGGSDIWDLFFSTESTQKWIFVRDHKTDRYYYGYVFAYSDLERERELILKEVDIYDNSTGEYLETVDTIYLARNRDDLTLEVPTLSDELTVSAKQNIEEYS